MKLGDQPALDTGDVQQLYSSVFLEFAKNQHVNLFDRPDYHLRPQRSAESRSSGLFEVLGVMVAHSIAQTGVGFPYISPVCYWYLIGGEECSLPYLSVEDVGTDVATVVTKVYYWYISIVVALLNITL